MSVASAPHSLKLTAATTSGWNGEGFLGGGRLDQSFGGLEGALMADPPDKRDRKAALATSKAKQRAAASASSNAEPRLGKRPCPECGYQLISIDTFCPKCRDAVASLRAQARIGGVVAVAFSVWTVYLVWDGFTWWALLTGLIAMFGAGLIWDGLRTKPGKWAAAGLQVEREQRTKREAEKQQTAELKARKKADEARAKPAPEPYTTPGEKCPHCGEWVELYFESYHEQMSCPKCLRPVR